MSAPLGGTGDLKFWGEDDRPTYRCSTGNFIRIGAGAVVRKDGQVDGLGGLVQARKKDKEQHPFQVDGKEIFSNRSKQAKPKAGEKTDKKRGKRQSVRWKAWWRQGNIKCAVSEEYASCWIHQDCHVADEQKAALKKAAGVSGGKDECQVRLKGSEHEYWMGTEIGMLGGYGFQGQVTAGDGSDKQSKMGVGYNKLEK